MLASCWSQRRDEPDRRVSVAPFGQLEARVLEMVRRAGRPVRHLEPPGGPLSSGPPPGLVDLALTLIRNAPLFALVAAARLATLLDGHPLAGRTGWREQAGPALGSWLVTSWRCWWRRVLGWGV